jgi:MinD superfamily P-loop ATPase
MTETGQIFSQITVQPPRVWINTLKCTGCGTCAEVCPFGLPKQDDSGTWVISLVEACTDCSACKRNCPAGAIVMTEQAGCGCLWDVASRKGGLLKAIRGRLKHANVPSDGQCCADPSDPSCCQ